MRSLKILESNNPEQRCPTERSCSEFSSKGRRCVCWRHNTCSFKHPRRLCVCLAGRPLCKSAAETWTWPSSWGVFREVDGGDSTLVLKRLFFFLCFTIGNWFILNCDIKNVEKNLNNNVTFQVNYQLLCVLRHQNIKYLKFGFKSQLSLFCVEFCMFSGFFP